MTLAQYRSDTIPVFTLTRGISILYPEIERLAIAEAIETDFQSRQDILPVLMIPWKNTVGSRKRSSNEQKMISFLCERFNMDTLKIVRI